MDEKLQAILNERTLVIMKPDAVRRALEERILARFLDAGFEVVVRKRLYATREQIAGHLPKDPEWIKGMGNKTLASYKESGDDPMKTFGSANPMVIGRKINQWIYDYLMSGQILVCVLRGAHAVKTVRKLVGNTIPADAAPGTIRGDFSIDSAPSANRAGRACHNVVHASGTVEEAEHEIANWFTRRELSGRERVVKTRKEAPHGIPGIGKAVPRRERDRGATRGGRSRLRPHDALQARGGKRPGRPVGRRGH